MTNAYQTDQQRWDAVAGRDAAADGAFYYAVRTTGIYCRPSCPARRPRRDRVSFHQTSADAVRAGYRPCKRCRPDDLSISNRHLSAVTTACRAIEAADAMPDVRRLAETAGLSRFHFHRVFKRITGLTPRAYASAHRAERVRAGLARSATVTEAIYDAGFNSSGRFYAAAPNMLGMSARAFRAGAPSRTIRFAIGECDLGSILVAASDKGVCAILLGDDPDALARDLQDRFPRATLVGGDADFERWVAEVVGFVQAPRHGLGLPLDVQGTAFQQRVWRALCDIPPGSTASYSAIARALGKPTAARAVAHACGANPIAVAIPCHRVVRTNGMLAGYRWGVERKRALLTREATADT